VPEALEPGVSEAPDPRDAADVAAVLAGERERFRGLVERHGPRVYDLARRLTRDAHLAEDVVQHAFARAFEALARYDPARPFRHWLLRIATNLCRNLHARRSHRRETTGGRGDDDAPFDPPERTPMDPAAALETEVPVARAASLRAAVDALPERYRLAIVLHHLHGLPLEEVGAILGVPVATVKTHLFRGREALKAALLGPEAGPETGLGPVGTTP
jgi:RNA polymerase sigma factor (sigma-70 family)